MGFTSVRVFISLYWKFFNKNVHCESCFGYIFEKNTIWVTRDKISNEKLSWTHIPFFWNSRRGLYLCEKEESKWSDKIKPNCDYCAIVSIWCSLTLFLWYKLRANKLLAITFSRVRQPSGIHVTCLRDPWTMSREYGCVFYSSKNKPWNLYRILLSNLDIFLQEHSIPFFAY